MRIPPQHFWKLGNVRVGILPEREESLILAAGFRGIYFPGIGSSELKMGQGTRGGVPDDAAMVDDFLKLGGGFEALPEFGPAAAFSAD